MLSTAENLASQSSSSLKLSKTLLSQTQAFNPKTQGSSFAVSKLDQEAFNYHTNGKENMPISLIKKQTTLSVNNKNSSQNVIEKRKLKPYVLVPPFKHPQPSSKDRQNGKATERSSIAVALSKQFSRYTAPSKPAETSRRNGLPDPGFRRQASKKRRRSVDEQEPLRKRLFVDDRESSSDELLLSEALPTRKPISPVRKQVEVVIEIVDSSDSSQRAGKSDQRRASVSISSEADTSRSISPILVTPRDKGKEKQQALPEEEDPDAWTGPPCNLFAKEPPLSKEETICISRIFAEGLKQAEAIERSGSTRYKPPLQWLELTRVHGRSPFVTRSEARTERYAAILEELYGSGNVLRGHGRKPNIVKLDGVSRTRTERDEPSEMDENANEKDDEREEGALSDSMPAPEASLLSAAHAPLLDSTIDSPDQPLPISSQLHGSVIEEAINEAETNGAPETIASKPDNVDSPIIEIITPGVKADIIEAKRARGSPIPIFEDEEILPAAAPKTAGRNRESSAKSKEPIVPELTEEEQWELVTPGVKEDLKRAELGEMFLSPEGAANANVALGVPIHEQTCVGTDSWPGILQAVIAENPSSDQVGPHLEKESYHEHLQRANDIFNFVEGMITSMFGSAAVNELVGCVATELERMKNLPDSHPMVQEMNDHFKLRSRAEKLLGALRVNEVISSLSD